MNALARKAAEKRALPPKESATFKSIARFYDLKQYKKGAKAADQILKKFPQHGETLAMKGLTYNCMNRKEEARALVKEGIRYDMMSHVVWHVFGLLHRSDRNYAEAVKSYRNALKHDPENLQILRDMALLQIQQRDLEGFLETRLQLLQQKTNLRANWIQLAVAYQMNKDPEQAIKVLNAYGRASATDSPDVPYEMSELALYKNSLIHATGDVQRALDHLDSDDAKAITDQRSRLERKVDYLTALARHEDAAKILLELLDDNPDNRAYMYDYFKAKRGGKEAGADPAAIVKQCDEWIEKYPRSLPAKRIPLDWLKGDEFSARLAPFLSHFLKKGIPSAFSNVSALYGDADKTTRVQKYVESVYTSLKSGSTFPGESDKASGNTALVWTCAYLARHHAYLKEIDTALKYIDEAIALDPKELDLCLIRAEVLDKAGAWKEASEWTEKGRLMDLADRYINCNSVRQLFRANLPEAADKVVVLFTKDGDQPNNLYDMQATWYEIAAARCYRRLKEIGKALKKFTAIEKHFTDMIEDQFDFHSYCTRKLTLRAYIRMLEVTDEMPGHARLAEAVEGAIDCYLAVHAKPPPPPGEVDEDKYKGMSEAEKKKQMRKDKKAAMKKAAADAEAKEKAEAAAAKNKGKGHLAPTIDQDPDGVELASTKDPLGEATKLLRLIYPHRKHSVSTNTIAARLYIAKGKLLPALRAARIAVAADAEDPQTRLAVVRVVKAIQDAAASMKPEVKAVTDKVVAELLSSANGDVSKYNTALAGKSFAHQLSAARGHLILTGDNKAASQQVVGADLASANLDDLSLACTVLRDEIDDMDALSAFKEAGKKVWPRADLFQ